MGRSWEGWGYWLFVSVRSLEFVKYFRSVKGKNIGKFDFYLTFNSISAMLKKYILLSLLFIIYNYRYEEMLPHWWIYSSDKSRDETKCRLDCMTLHVELAAPYNSVKCSFGEGQAPLSNVAEIRYSKNCLMSLTKYKI